MFQWRTSDVWMNVQMFVHTLQTISTHKHQEVLRFSSGSQKPTHSTTELYLEKKNKKRAQEKLYVVEWNE